MTSQYDPMEGSNDNGMICPCCGRDLTFVGHQPRPDGSVLRLIHCTYSSCPLDHATTNNIIKTWVQWGSPNILEASS